MARTEVGGQGRTAGRSARPKLRGLSDLFTFARSSRTPVYFVSPTAYNVLGIDQWIGGVHPVQYGTTKKLIKNWRFTGVFRDFIIWPQSSRGVPVTWRFIVVVGKTKRVVNYTITPKA